MGIPSHISVDIEPTNRCNADCYFCPRDQTPHQGLMQPETFSQSLARAVELRDHAVTRGREVRISLCGLGEPLLNKHVPSFVADARALDFEVSMSSNAGLLDERRATALLDAGLQRIDINVGEIGEDYERIYELPWERTRDNILRFAEMADGACEVQIILVNHRGDPEHLEGVERYWRDRGLESFFSFSLINRGGALTVDHLQFDGGDHRAEAERRLSPEGGRPLCPWPFVSMVVGYDGRYYLCCSDWKKEVPLGTVADTTFVEILEEKVRQATERAAICRTCNLDPVNSLTLELQARDEGVPDTLDPDWYAGMLRQDSRGAATLLEDLGIDVAPLLEAPTPTRRVSIPVRAV